jgi:hypothetical protein
MSKYSYSTHHPLRYGGAPKTPISIAPTHIAAAQGATVGAGGGFITGLGHVPEFLLA